MRRITTRPASLADHDMIAMSRKDYRLMLAVVRAADKQRRTGLGLGDIAEAIDGFNKPSKSKGKP